MTEDQRLLANWAGINSALYCLSVFISGIYFDNPFAWKLAITTFGVCYLLHGIQMWYPGTMIVKALIGISILTGLAAGLSLLR